jgi:hypothetical protein
MRQNDYLVWFLELEHQFKLIQIKSISNWYALPEAVGWLTEAASLVNAAIPVDHVCKQDWVDFETRVRTANSSRFSWEGLFAIFQVAHRLGPGQE